MNLRQRPQTNPTLTALPVGPTQRTPRLSPLSARQLFDVELGLCLLAAISPSASPATLPDLLIDGTAQTAKQRRSLDKARLMLAQLTQPSRPGGTRSLWADLLDRYARLSHDTQAFDISCDGNRFSPKSVGFFRNRVRTLTHLLA